MARRRDWTTITRRNSAIERWERSLLAQEDAEEIAETRRIREAWNDEYDPSLPSYVERDLHPESEW